MRVAAGRPQLLRRSRGYVPSELPLPVAPAGARLLACGAEQKNTFGVAKGTRAWLGHHIGDLENYETLRSFSEGIAHFQRLFAVEPELVVHDLHPEYLSTKHALALEGVRPMGVQHHHAHLAACLAEHGEEGRAVGAIFDGTGYGSDGTVWGGELLLGDLCGFERVGMLFPVRLPGGAAAVRQPWRMACAWLGAALGGEAALPRALRGRRDRARLAAGRPSSREPGWPRRSPRAWAGCSTRWRRCAASAPRSTTRARQRSSSRRAATPASGARTSSPSRAPLVMDARPVVAELVGELEQGVAVPLVAARFHNAVAQATARACVLAAERGATETVGLSGGVFQNRRLLERSSELLGAAGLRVLVAERLPPNDGGIAYGQLAVAAARLAAEEAAVSEPADAAAILAEPVFAGGETKPFAELTLAEVEARAQELRDVSGWGPTAKVRSVAMEWGMLARSMAEQGAQSVGDVGPRGARGARAEALDRAARRQPALSRGAARPTLGA